MASVTVTILFTDLVKSTELLARAGEERAEEVRRELFELMRGAIAEHGGHEVKNVGDGLMVAFDGVIDGLSCAVAIQRAMYARNRRAAEPLALRVAISSGEADVDDGDYFGVPVVEAARLVAIADGNEILTTEIVRLLAGTRGDFEFVSRGPTTLKGLDAPVLVHEVRWSPATGADGPVPFPARLEREEAAVFVGRDAPLALLDEALKQTDVSARRRIVLLSGEPGIGKTTLVSRFATNACANGAIALYGRCDEDLRIPYQPWVEALTHLVEHLPEDDLRDHVVDRGADLRALVPALARRVQPLPEPSTTDPDVERHLMFGAVVDLLARASAGAPVVLVLDDLHWADRTTLQLLRHVASSAADLRLLVLGTFREADLGAHHPLTDLLAVLHRESGIERIALGGLDDLELLALMEAASGQAMAADGLALRDELLSETDGNPFFVVEILRHLAETGAIAPGNAGHWVARSDLRGTGLPVSVREVVGRRVERLGEDATKVLSTASVIGRDFDLVLLARVVDLDEDRLLDVLDEALQAYIVSEAPGASERYTFVHALIQRTLYDDLSTPRRRRLHRRIASALEELPGSRTERVAELARHWYEATQPEDAARAYEYALAAGDDAQARLAPDEAVRWFTQALELVDPTDRSARCETMIKVGVAQRLAAVPGYRETLLDACNLAQSIGDTTRLVAAVLANTRGFQSNSGQVDEDRVRELRAALVAVGDGSEATRARLLALLATESHYAPGVDVQALLDEALALTASLDDASARLFAIRAAQVYFPPHNLELRRALLEEEERLVESSDPARRAWARSARAQIEFQSGSAAEILREANRRFRAEAERVGDPAITWAAQFGGAMVSMMWDDPAEAERAIEDAFRFGTESGQPDALAVYAGQLLGLRQTQGRGGEAVGVVEEVVAATPGIPAFRSALAELYVQAGRRDEARAILDDFCAGGIDNVPVDVAWSTLMGAVANVAGLIEHRSSAAQVAPLIAPFRAQVVFSGVTVDAPFAMWLGVCYRLLERYDEADAAFREALEINERIEHAHGIALTKLEWACMLRARGNADDEAQEASLLNDALDAARRRGYRFVADRAAALLNP